MKIIPAIDLMDGQVVRLYKGDPKQKTVYSNDPVSVAKKWQDAGADMLHIVDLDATIGTGSNLDLVEQITKELSIPVEVAGGLRSEEIVDRVIPTHDPSRTTGAQDCRSPPRYFPRNQRCTRRPLA